MARSFRLLADEYVTLNANLKQGREAIKRRGLDILVYVSTDMNRYDMIWWYDDLVV